MKTILIASTALIAVASVAQASEPLSLKVTGYMYAGIGYVDNGVNLEDIGIMRDGEIHFKVKGSSDNGLTFAARVELEAFTSGDQIDENYVTVSGSFGTVLIGANDYAINNMATGVIYAPGGKIGHYDSFAESGYDSSMNIFGDDIGITYTTPNFNGLQAQFTYQPNGGSDGGGDTNTLSLGAQDELSAALNYRGEFDGFAIQLSGGYAHADIGTGDFTQWMAGARGEFGGFVVGAFWQNYDFDTAAGDANDFVINAAYSTGPWTIGAGYAFTEAGGANYGISGGLADTNKFAGWATYALAPGVSVTGAAEYYDQDTGGNDGFAAMLYMGLSF